MRVSSLSFWLPFRQSSPIHFPPSGFLFVFYFLFMFVVCIFSIFTCVPVCPWMYVLTWRLHEVDVRCRLQSVSTLYIETDCFTWTQPTQLVELARLVWGFHLWFLKTGIIGRIPWTELLRIWTLVFKFEWQLFYSLSHLFSPSLFWC